MMARLVRGLVLLACAAATACGWSGSRVPGRVVFVASLSAKSSVRVMDLGRRSSRAVTESGSRDDVADYFISWSPDASRMALIRQSAEQARSRPSAAATLYVIDVESGAMRSMGSYDSINGSVSWSPDGRRLAFTARSDSPGYVPTGLVDLSARIGTPAYRYPADYYGQHVVVMDAGGTNRKQITAGSNQAYLGVSWSPAGDELAVYAVSPQHYWELYLMRPDGTEQRRLTFDSRTHLGIIARGNYPEWAPDGQRLVIVGATGDQAPRWEPDEVATVGRSVFAGRDGDWSLYTIGRDGQDYSRLSTIEGSQSNAAWAADGSRIAFDLAIRDPFGTPRTPEAEHGGIYTIDANGGNMRKIVASTEFALYSVPSWCEDGEHLAFMGSVLRPVDVSTLKGQEFDNWIRSQRSDAYIVKADGTALEKLTRDGDSGEPECSPPRSAAPLAAAAKTPASSADVERLADSLIHGFTPNERGDAARGLGAIGSARALDVLARALRDSDGSTQQAIVESLEQNGWTPRTQGERIEYLLAKGDWNSLTSIGEYVVEPVDHYLAGIWSWDPAEEQLAAVGAAAVPALRLAAADSDTCVRRIAQDVLTRIGAGR